MVTTDNLFTKPSTPQTEKVMNYMKGNRTERQVIQEFFGLDDRIVMDVDGTSVLEIFNDFIDPVKLQEKNVKWNDKLADLGVTKERFDALLGKYLAYGQKDSTPSNGETNEPS